jgi:predicted transcriptional regulator
MVHILTRMPRKIPITFTVELDQIERLGRITARTRVTRSVIVRDAIERELARYELEEQQEGKVEVHQNGAA